jgi:hypothetical protein
MQSSPLYVRTVWAMMLRCVLRAASNHTFFLCLIRARMLTRDTSALHVCMQGWLQYASKCQRAQHVAWRHRCTAVLRAWHRHTRRQQLLQLGVQQLQRVWAARRAALVLRAWRMRVQRVQQHQVASATLAAADRWAA